MEAKGTIEIKQECKSKEDKKYWKLTIDGKTYSVWDYDLCKEIYVDDLISFEYTEKEGEGKHGTVIYKNIQSIEKQQKIVKTNDEIQDDKVRDYKSREADVYELGMAKNNAMVFLTKWGFNGGEEDELFEEYWKVVDRLFEEGKKKRKEIIGY